MKGGGLVGWFLLLEHFFIHHQFSAVKFLGVGGGKETSALRVVKELLLITLDEITWVKEAAEWEKKEQDEYEG